MLRSLRWLGVVAVACLLLAGCAGPPKPVLDESQRAVPGGRDALVVVPQGEISDRIHPVIVPTGGLIGVLIETGINQIKTDMAERQVTPLRNALADYDFDHRALAATQAMLAKVSWLDVQKVAFSKDGSDDALTKFVDDSPTPQSLIARYDYSLSPNFQWMNVTLTVGIYPKTPAANATGGRLAPGNALYYERFEYIEYLPQNLDDDDKNAASWASDNGIQARQALDRSLAGIQDLFLRSMSLSPEAAAALDQGRGIGMSDEDGKLVESSAHSFLLYNKDKGAWIYYDGKPAPN